MRRIIDITLLVFAATLVLIAPPIHIESDGCSHSGCQRFVARAEVATTERRGAQALRRVREFAQRILRATGPAGHVTAAAARPLSPSVISAFAPPPLRI